MDRQPLTLTLRNPNAPEAGACHLTLEPVDYGDPGSLGWHGSVEVSLPGAAPVLYHADMMTLEEFEARGYQVDEPGDVYTLNAPVGPCVLVLAPYQK